MAMFRSTPIFDGLPQELRDQIYLEVVRSSEHPFTVKSNYTPSDLNEDRLKNIFALRHPLQAVNRKILRDFEETALAHVSTLEVAVTDFHFTTVANVFEKHFRLLKLADFRESLDPLGRVRNLSIHITFSDDWLEYLSSRGGSRRYDRAKGGVRYWQRFCVVYGLKGVGYIFDKFIALRVLGLTITLVAESRLLQISDAPNEGLLHALQKQHNEERKSATRPGLFFGSQMANRTTAQ